MAKLFLTAIDLNQNELKKAVVENYAGNPNGAVSGVEGQLLWDSTNNVLYTSTGGTVWVSAGSDTNTTYSQSAVSTTGGALLRLTAGGSGAGNDDIKLANGTGITCAYTDADTITISSTVTDTNWYPTTFAWTGGTTAGPTGSLTGSGMSAVSFAAIPAASSSASGIVTTGAQQFAGNKTFDNDVTVTGNLTVNGTTTAINTATLNVSDNIVILNNDVTGTPTENAGIEVERGTSANVLVRWNETSDYWEATIDGTNYAPLVRKYAETLSTSATSYTVTHNLGTSDVVVAVKAVASPYAEVICDIEQTSTTAVTIKFATAPSANTYRVVVVG